MKSILLFLCLILAASLLTPAAAEIDCDVLPEPGNWKDCCRVPNFFNDEFTEKCQEYDVPMEPPHPHPRQHPRPHPHLRPPHPHHHPCFFSCVLNETGILNEERQLDETKLHDYLTEIYKDEILVWIPLFEESFKTCMIKREEMHAFFAARKEQKSERKFTPPPCMVDVGILMGCIYIESFEKCPSSSWNDSDDCNNLRDYFINCKPENGKWHGKHGDHSPSDAENDVS